MMQLVTAGGRLECPNSLTPPLVYDIMMQCWNASPELRPNFTTIIDSIGNCLRDPNILNVPLPIFHRSASMEKDVRYKSNLILFISIILLFFFIL